MRTALLLCVISVGTVQIISYCVDAALPLVMSGAFL